MGSGQRSIFRTWWPLAASWLLMGAEQPALAAVIARLAYPEVNLAAWGGIVYPLALIIESPIIMLLAASTALSRDMDAYRKLQRFMMVTGAGITAFHLLMALTPLYDVVARGLIGAPAEILEPARLGLIIMAPWSWSIGYRRFNQGTLIRWGHSRAVGAGTLIRLCADAVVLAAAYFLVQRSVPGVAIAAAAVITGVIGEAIYSGLVIRPVLRDQISAAPPAGQPITLRFFLAFYGPLVLTSLLSLAAQPIGSAALSRMPQPLESLAVWPVVTGLAFMLRALGIAFNEVVVALLDEPGAPGEAAARLWRFALRLAGSATLGLTLIAATPVADFWFGTVTALDPRLAGLARSGLWLTLPLPALSVMQSWYQGTLVNRRRTRGISEAVALYLVTTGLILAAGVAWVRVPGVYVGLTALVVSLACQTAWLWWRTRALPPARPGES